MRNQDEDFTEFEREETAPLDMLAALFEARGWDFEPVSDEEVSAEFKGSWTSYQIRAIWRERLICTVKRRWWNAQVPVMRRAIILPRSVTKSRSKSGRL